jgi:hypothetical protein
VTQDGSSAGSDGVLNVTPGKTVKVDVPVSAINVRPQDQSLVTVALKAGSQTVTETIQMANSFPKDGTVVLHFPVTFSTQDVGDQIITVTLTPSSGLGEVNSSNNSASTKVRVAGGSNVLISAVHVTQVVPDFSLEGAGVISLVQGKKAVVQAFLKGQNVSPTDSRSVTVQLKAPGNPSPVSTSVPLSAIASAPSEGYEVDLFTTPTSLGSASLSVTVDPNHLLQPSPAVKEVSVSVEKTRNLNIGFVGIDGCTPPADNCYKSHLTNFNDSVANMSTFIQATYPIADVGSKIGAFPGGPTFYGTVVTTTPVSGKPTPSDFIGANKDLLNLSIMGKLSSPPMDYVGGVVPSGYFSYHNLSSPLGDVVGYSGHALGQSSFLVEESAWTAAAHEIGHSFGLLDDYTSKGCPYTVSGFWPSHNPPIPIYNLPGIMCGTEPNNLLAQWMSEGVYSQIFQSLKKPAIDPEVILVSGLLMKDGNFQSSALYHKSDGYLTESQNGNFSVNMLDPSGAVLSTTSQQINFSAFINPIGLVSTDSTPVVLSVPYSPDTDQIRITFNNQTISSISTGTALLKSAITSIPDSSFFKFPIKERKRLLLDVNEIEDVLKLCQRVRSSQRKGENVAKLGCVSAVVRLMVELRETVDRVLNDSIEKSALQMTKSDVLRTLDSVILHTVPNLEVASRKKSFEILILPMLDRDDRGLFMVTSVTQGLHGSVEIGRKGTLIYKPSSQNRVADQFAVTLTDLEGDSVVKTVNIFAPDRNRDDDKEPCKWVQ